MTGRRLIKRTTADRMVSEFLDRVRAVNADQRFACIVTRVVLFGSYVNSDRDMIGDIDIGFEIEPRFSGPLWRDIEYRKQCEHDAHCSTLEWLNWPREEVLRAIRGRNRYISLHSVSGDTDAIFSDVHREMDIGSPKTVELPEAVPCSRCGGTRFDFYYEDFEGASPIVWFMGCRSCNGVSFVTSAIGIEDLVRSWNSGDLADRDYDPSADPGEVES